MTNTIFVPDLYAAKINAFAILWTGGYTPFDSLQTFVYDRKQLSTQGSE
jgi:hypothetical protein